MFKRYLTFILLTATSSLFAQNIEFKSSNFKDKKEEFKKAEQAIENGDVFYKIANDAIFLVQNPGRNYKNALIEYFIAQKFNANNAELNLK